MGKGYIDLTPEQRAAMAERVLSLKLFSEKHGLKETPERLRLFGEKHGLKRVAETFRNAKTAPATTQEQTPQPKKRKSGGGNKPKLEEKQIDDGKDTYRKMLADDPTWAENKTASAKRVIEKLMSLKGVSWWTVKRWVVEPVLKEREQNKRRR